jgi:AcrR family transcriptional regulator
MARVSKEPEKRRQELIDAAQRLFMAKGYDKTAVSDIVKELNVAQGTFYYHFKSKTEILEEVVKKSILSLVDEIRLIAEAGDIDPVAKLNRFFGAVVRFGSLNVELVNFIHQQRNLMLHQRLGNITATGIVPVLSRIIQDGTSQGIFTVAHPTQTARFVLLGAGELFHDPEIRNDPEGIKKARITVEQCVARVLGIKEGSFRMSF